VLEYVASMQNYIVYHDTVRGNYKIHNGFNIIAYPSTEQDAFNKLRAYTKSKNLVVKCDGCTIPSCNECERYYND